VFVGKGWQHDVLHWSIKLTEKVDALLEGGGVGWGWGQKRAGLWEGLQALLE